MYPSGSLAEVRVMVAYRPLTTLLAVMLPGAPGGWLLNTSTVSLATQSSEMKPRLSRTLTRTCTLVVPAGISRLSVVSVERVSVCQLPPLSRYW